MIGTLVIDNLRPFSWYVYLKANTETNKHVYLKANTETNKHVYLKANTETNKQVNKHLEIPLKEMLCSTVSQLLSKRMH